MSSCCIQSRSISRLMSRCAAGTVPSALTDQGSWSSGDIIPTRVSALTDAIALLSFGAGNGFFGAALVGLARTVASDYWQLRSDLGLTRYDESAIIEKLAKAGFSARRAPTNIGHNQARMTFLAKPA
jgi:hypothetical protein